MSADPKADMQDVLYGCLMHDRYDTSEQALDALMPHVDRYVAAELRRLVDTLVGQRMERTASGWTAFNEVCDRIRRRAAELEAS